MAVVKGEERFFIPETKYNARHARKIVRIREAGLLVSSVESEDGSRFAAFNSELKRASREDDHVGGY